MRVNSVLCLHRTKTNMPATRNSGSYSNSLVKDLSSKLSGNGKLIVTTLLNEMSKMKEELMDLISAKNVEIDSLKTDVVQLREQVKKLESYIDEEDSYIRKDTLIFSGTSVPEVATGENCITVVTNLLKNKLNLELNSSEINTAHRLGKRTESQMPDKRSLIVKLCRRDTKSQIISASRAARVSGLYVNESLTPTRRSILYGLRQIRRAHPNLVVGCSSFDGKVFVYTKPAPNAPPNSRNLRQMMNTREKLEMFCRDFIKKPLEDFIDSWP